MPLSKITAEKNQLYAAVDESKDSEVLIFFIKITCKSCILGFSLATFQLVKQSLANILGGICVPVYTKLQTLSLRDESGDASQYKNFVYDCVLALVCLHPSSGWDEFLSPAGIFGSQELEF